MTERQIYLSAVEYACCHEGADPVEMLRAWAEENNVGSLDFNLTSVILELFQNYQHVRPEAFREAARVDGIHVD